MRRGANNVARGTNPIATAGRDVSSFGMTMPMLMSLKMRGVVSDLGSSRLKLGRTRGMRERGKRDEAVRSLTHHLVYEG